MINPITNALQEVHYAIPREVLTEVFGKEDYQDWRRAAPTTVDEMMMSKVVRPRVLKDCNLVGGRQAIIDLQGLGFYSQDAYSTILEIPLERTGNREIISVLSVNYLPTSAAMGSMGTAYGSINPVNQSEFQTVGMKIMDSFGAMPHVAAAQVELIAYNTIVIRDKMRATEIFELRCMLANEENLTNIQPNSYPVIAELVRLAIESYIFKTLRIRLGRGQLEQGMDLTQFREAVDDYRESEKEYKDYLKNTARAVFFMNDTLSHDRFIGVQLNPGL